MHLWSKGQPSGPFRKAVRSSPARTKMTFFSFFFQYRIFFVFWSFFFFFVRVCVSLLSRPPLLLFVLGSQAMPSLQTLHPPAPYPYPPSCTSILLVARCLPPQHPSLHANNAFFFFPLGTASARSKPLDVCFAPGFVVQVLPHSPYTPELQLF
jgi:hypothetical protein